MSDDEPPGDRPERPRRDRSSGARSGPPDPRGPRRQGPRDEGARRPAGDQPPRRRPGGDGAQRDRFPRDGRPKDGAPRDAARRATGRPARRDGVPPGAERGRRSSERGGRVPGSDRPVRDGARRGDARPPSHGDRPERAGRHVDEPELPDDVRAGDLERAARNELRTLSKENADAVARHLVMAVRLIEDDPTEAHRHALAAGRRAGRVAVVRESVAITAYAVGDFALALRELRTFRRISGSDDQIALMVDSERGVGRPDRALELGRGVDRSALPPEAQVGLAMAMSGARLDLGDPAGALDELERAPYDLGRVLPWSADLYSAFAAVHDDLGHEAEASAWRARADTADSVLDEVGEEESTVGITTEYAEAAPEEQAPGQDGTGAEASEQP